VEKFFGVGKVTAEKMKKMGLHTGTDLKKLTEKELTKYFGKAGRFYYNIVRGIDDRRVEPDRETKSVGAEDTFAFDLTTIEEMNSELERIAETVCDRLQRHKLKGRTVTLKIKYGDFKQITRNRSFLHPIDDLETITETAKQLLALTETEDKAVRLLGITLSNFGEVQPVIRKVEDMGQLRLF
jgi:DNA polymerase-4